MLTQMAALQVKNVPEELHEALRTRAKTEGMTVSQYILELLQRELSLPSQAEWFMQLEQREPIEGIDGAAAVRAARAERDAELAARHRRS